MLDEPREKAPAYDSVDRYRQQTVEGWGVLVHEDLLAEEPLAEAVLRELQMQLYRIVRRLPPKAVARLRAIPVWVERRHPKHPCMCYHTSPRWLFENGMNPKKAGAIEIANAENFLSWTHDQPWMVLHELAHAYHDRFLVDGFDNAQVRAAFEAAKEAGIYEKVLHARGRQQRAYALTNPMEYFAESTEAFFGRNDFYPFVRAELKQHDPAMFELLQQLWEADDK